MALQYIFYQKSQNYKILVETNDMTKQNIVPAQFTQAKNHIQELEVFDQVPVNVQSSQRFNFNDMYKDKRIEIDSE